MTPLIDLITEDPRRMTRHFCDDAGLLWDVYEVEPSGRTELTCPEEVLEGDLAVDQQAR